MMDRDHPRAFERLRHKALGCLVPQPYDIHKTSDMGFDTFQEHLLHTQPPAEAVTTTSSIPFKDSILFSALLLQADHKLAVGDFNNLNSFNSRQPSVC